MTARISEAGRTATRALTVRQPYADAIVHGSKRVENRTKALPARYAGVPVLLHAGQAPHASGITTTGLAAATGDRVDGWPGLRSVVLAVVTFRGSHRAPVDGAWCCRPWGQVVTATSPEVWHWEIERVERLTYPVPASGALGFWTVPDDVLAAVRQELPGLQAVQAR